MVALVVHLQSNASIAVLEGLREAWLMAGLAEYTQGVDSADIGEVD
jgi:hypothetical protein